MLDVLSIFAPDKKIQNRISKDSTLIQSAKIRIKIEMTKRKRIKLRYGAIPILMRECSVSKATVIRALGWEADTDVQNVIRRRARELGLIRRF